MNAKHLGTWLGTSLLVAVLTGCGPELVGSGHLVEEERQTSDFVKLDVSDGIGAQVIVDPTQPTKVRLVGDDNLVAKVRTDLTGGKTLHVFFHPDDVGDWSSRNPLRVEVTVQKLESFSIETAGSAELSGAITSSLLEISASGASTVGVRGLATESLEVDLSGASEVTVEGSSSRVLTHMSGASKLHGRQLSAREAKLNSSGASSTVLQVSNSLQVEASGGSEVRIIGRPALPDSNLSGGSTLTFE